MYRSNNYSTGLREKYYKSGRKAVASHSQHGESNPNALSKYLQNELSMHSDDRKNFVLPCGYTLAQSWDALRKCWKGFIISKSKNNLGRMLEYASRIRKLQQEIGIQVTQFTTDILDEQDLNTVQAKNSCYVQDKDEIRRNKVKVSTKMMNSCLYIPPRERAPNYDDLLDTSGKLIESNDPARPSAKEEIFSKPRSRHEKSCHYIPPKKGTHQFDSENESMTHNDGDTIWYVNPAGNSNFQSRSPKQQSYESSAEIGRKTKDDDNFRWYVNPGDINIQPRLDEHEHVVDDDENCCDRSPEHRQTEDEEERKRKRGSCTYKRGSVD